MATLTSRGNKKTSPAKPENSQKKRRSHFSNVPYSIKEDHLYIKKRVANMEKIFQRISPFLILVVGLPILLLYFHLTDTGAIQNGWLSAFMFLFLASNILLSDFALWNYFEGKKKPVIWLIELMLSSILIYILV